VNTFQTNFAAMKTKRLLVGSLWIPLVATLIAMSVAGPMAWATEVPRGSGELKDKLKTAEGQNLTVGQMLSKLAARLNPPYTGHNDTDLTNFLGSLNPPIMPGDLNKPATVGDLVVFLCRLNHVGPTGDNPTPQDYLDALNTLKYSNLSQFLALTTDLPVTLNLGLRSTGELASLFSVRTQTGP